MYVIKCAPFLNAERTFNGKRVFLRGAARRPIVASTATTTATTTIRTTVPINLVMSAIFELQTVHGLHKAAKSARVSSAQSEAKVTTGDDKRRLK
jgi:hypothetical protein